MRHDDVDLTEIFQWWSLSAESEIGFTRWAPVRYLSLDGTTNIVLCEGQCASAEIDLVVVTLLGAPRMMNFSSDQSAGDREVVIYALSTKNAKLE